MRAACTARSAAGRKFAKNRHKEQNKHVHDAEMSPEEALADVEQEAMSAFLRRTYLAYTVRLLRLLFVAGHLLRLSQLIVVA